MTAITHYTTSTVNEFQKLKRTFAFWLTIISALFIPIIYLLYYLIKYKQLIPTEGVNPWDKFIVEQIRAAVPLLVPMFIVLVTSLIVQIEHKSSGLKHLFALPIPKWSIYFGKLTAVVCTIIIAYTLFFIFMVSVGYIVGMIHEELKFVSFTPNYFENIKLLFRSFIAILGIVGLQFWLSFRMKNFIIPLGIGTVLIVTGLIVYRAEEAVYFPYAYNMLSLFPIDKDLDSLIWFPTVSIYSLGYFLLFSLIGYIDINRKNIT
ncbi:MAG: ABC transporter permease [Flavobacteriaceae bacterium]|nr:ABC transporter permease [Flavobacteriaceae bacterium]